MDLSNKLSVRAIFTGTVARGPEKKNACSLQPAVKNSALNDALNHALPSFSLIACFSCITALYLTRFTSLLVLRPHQNNVKRYNNSTVG
jgi:hypothetical protein